MARKAPIKFDRPKYIQNSFAITFPRCMTIRRNAVALEDLLKERFPGHYGQPQVVPVPDEMDPEVPRLVFGSTHGFSQLIVSQISILLNVTYSPEWQQDIEQGKSYLKERTKIIFMLHEKLGGPIYFSGITTRVQIPTGDSDKELFAHLKSFASERFWSNDPFDFHIQLAAVKRGKFFSNATIKNYRGWKNEDLHPGLRRLSQEDAIERGIEIIGDYNDRYAFNHEKDYHSSQTTASGIVDSAFSEVDQLVKMATGS